VWPLGHGFGKCPCAFGDQFADIVEVVGHRNTILFSIQFLLDMRAICHQPLYDVLRKHSNGHSGDNLWYKGIQYLGLLGRAWLFF